MAIPTRIIRNASCALGVIAVRAPDGAYMTWVAAEAESEHACARGLTRARHKVRARTWHTRSGRPRGLGSA
jgi:hypothetical protein